jgi:hypothetical protein
MFAELVRQPSRYYEAALGVRYPYPKCDLMFVPAYPALAFSTPELITFQERLLEQYETRPPIPVSICHANFPARGTHRTSQAETLLDRYRAIMRGLFSFLVLPANCSASLCDAFASVRETPVSSQSSSCDLRF